jgi:hypothetical protein
LNKQVNATKHIKYGQRIKKNPKPGFDQQDQESQYGNHVKQVKDECDPDRYQRELLSRDDRGNQKHH